MALVAVQYLSDDGNIYQMVAPSELLSLFNYTLAEGSEPFLPTFIAPRYANYQSSQPTLQLSGIIPLPFGVGNPPSQVSQGDNLYVLRQAVGEERNAATFQNLLSLPVIVGSPGADGPPGPPGSDNIVTVTGVLSSAQILSLDTAAVEIIPDPGGDTAIVGITAVFLNRFGTVPYVTAGEILLGTTGTPGFEVNNSFITSVSRAMQFCAPVTGLYGDLSMHSGFYFQATQPITAGDGDIEYAVVYTLLPMPA